jgi:hypothetical protein
VYLQLVTDALEKLEASICKQFNKTTLEVTAVIFRVAQGYCPEMEVARSSLLSVSNYTSTPLCIPEYRHLHRVQ